jgi:hypothetical protein
MPPALLNSIWPLAYSSFEATLQHTSEQEEGRPKQDSDSTFSSNFDIVGVALVYFGQGARTESLKQRIDVEKVVAWRSFKLLGTL